MITTNNIEMLIGEIERLPKQFSISPYMYKWLTNLLEEIKRQPTTAMKVEIAIFKSPKITDY